MSCNSLPPFSCCLGLGLGSVDDESLVKSQVIETAFTPWQAFASSGSFEL